MRCWNQPESLPLEVMLLPGFVGKSLGLNCLQDSLALGPPFLQSTCWVPKETEPMADTQGATSVLLVCRC